MNKMNKTKVKAETDKCSSLIFGSLMAAFFVLLYSGVTCAQTINTIAGIGAIDSGVATTTPILIPQGVAFDSNGNLYVSDSGKHRIFKMTPSGATSLVAGTGRAGFSGDGGPAGTAMLALPSGLAVDADGNVYVADCGNNRVRKISLAGIITTADGNGVPTYAGDGGAAIDASLACPTGLSIDASGNLLIADKTNRRVRKVTTQGTITTVAGVGASGAVGNGIPAIAANLGEVTSVIGDLAGAFYVVSGNDIRRIASNGIIATVAGNGSPGFSGDGGPAILAQLNFPSSIALDTSGNLYIADLDNNRIRKVNSVGAISTIAGDGSYGYAGDGGLASSARFRGVMSLAIDAFGDLFIADAYNQRIRRISRNGQIDTVMGNGFGDGGLANRAFLAPISGIAVDKDGNTFLAEATASRVRKVTHDGIISTIAGALGSGFGGDGGLAVNALLTEPSALAIHPNGDLYIADTYNNRVRKIASDGRISTVAGNGTGFCQSCGDSPTPIGDGGMAVNASVYKPDSLAFDKNGNLYISGVYNGRIRKVSPGGVISTYVGGGNGDADSVSATSIYLYHPHGIAADISGNLFITQYSDNVIRKVTPAGIITTIAGNHMLEFSGDGGPATSAGINNPSTLALDAVGNLYFSSSYSERIRSVDAGGLINTVAGNGIAGYSGDGGLAINASLQSLGGIAVDEDGSLLFGAGGLDGDNYLRKVTFPFSLARVASRKLHGNTKVYEVQIDSNIPIGGLPTVEPRSIGLGHAVVFRFNETVAYIGTIEVKDSNGLTIGNVSPAIVGKEVVLALTAVPESQNLSISINDVNGILSVRASMRFLVGDVNGSGAVNASDIVSVKTRIGQAISWANFQIDINASGSIDSADLALVKARVGTALH